MAAQSRPPRFLLTRPAAQGARFGEGLRQRFSGAEVIESPLIAPRFLAPALPEGPFLAAIFTSETGVEAARRLAPPVAVSAYCVGMRTARAAEAAGYRAHSADGDAEELVAAILRDNPSGRLIHLHGAETRGDIAGRLKSAGIETLSCTVYSQDAQPLTPEAKAALSENRALLVPLFSPRTAAIFSTEAAASRSPLHIAALSPAVAEAIRLSPAALTIAARPDAEAMLDALAALLFGAGDA